jgi:hypothetical protein
VDRDKHMQNERGLEKELIRLRRFMPAACGANYPSQERGARAILPAVRTTLHQGG